MKNILIIGAHFDDVELAACGSAIKWLKEGKKIFKLVLTDNKTNFVQYNIKVNYKKTLKESNKICKITGIKELFLKKPVKCNYLKYDTKLMQEIESIIFKNEIDTVLFHSPYDANQDHKATYELCITAARHCKNILLYKSNAYIDTRQFKPNYFVDISQYIKIKKNALSMYDKNNNRGGERLFDTTLEINHYYGYINGVEFAEGFELIKMVN